MAEPMLLHTLTAAHLPELEQLLGTPHRAMLPALRWHLHTPYATVLGLYHGPRPVAAGALLHLGAVARITLLMHAMRGATEVQAFRAALLARALALEATGEEVQVHAYEAPAWEALGFRRLHAYTHYSAGRSLQATEEEVMLLEPAHTLALLHLDQRATGHDRRALLLEHRFVAHAYVEHARLRGGLLPLLGHGLVLADAPPVGLELLRWLLPHQPHVVVPVPNSAACTHLQQQGYRATPAGVHLVYGATPTPRPELVYAWPWMPLLPSKLSR